MRDRAQLLTGDGEERLGEEALLLISASFWGPTSTFNDLPALLLPFFVRYEVNESGISANSLLKEKEYRVILMLYE